MEVVESLSTSSFINALRRFTAIRGPAKLFRSDRGMNFVGACKELGTTPEKITSFRSTSKTKAVLGTSISLTLLIWGECGKNDRSCQAHSRRLQGAFPQFDT